MKFFYPYEMSCLYPYPAKLDYHFSIAPLGVAAFFAAAYWLWKNNYKAWVFGMAFFFFNVVFLLQVLGAGQAFLADRFTYIPYLGFFFIVAYYVNKFSEENHSNKTILLGVVGAFLLFSAFKTRKQCDVWTNGATLWTKALEYYPDSDLPWSNRARYYRENEQDYLKALEGYTQAIKMKPKAEAHNSRGKTYFDLAAYPELMKKLNLTTQECTKKALEDYSAALKLDTTFMERKTLAEVYANRGAAYGRYSEETKDNNYLQNSLSDLTNAMRIDSTNENSFLNGFLVNSQLNNLQQALVCIDRFNKLKPGESDMYYERAIIHRKLNDDATAIKDLEVSIQNALAEVRSQDLKKRNRGKLILGASNNELARIYYKMGDNAKAKTYILEAIRYEFPGIDTDVQNGVK
jgi:tetratricopeptide (TPR) repeat protein